MSLDLNLEKNMDQTLPLLELSLKQKFFDW